MVFAISPISTSGTVTILTVFSIIAIIPTGIHPGVIVIPPIWAIMIPFTMTPSGIGAITDIILPIVIIVTPAGIILPIITGTVIITGTPIIMAFTLAGKKYPKAGNS